MMDTYQSVDLTAIRPSTQVQLASMPQLAEVRIKPQVDMAQTVLTRYRR